MNDRSNSKNSLMPTTSHVTKKVFMVTYDPNILPDDHSRLSDALTEFENWWHFIRGSWLVVGDGMDAKAVMRKLKKSIPSYLYLLVVEVEPDFAGQLPDEAWEWIEENLAGKELVAH